MSVSVDPRIEERRREVRTADRKRRLRRTVSGVLVLVLLALGFAIERSDLVALQAVEVTGLSRLEADDVRRAAALEIGTSTLRLRLGAAEARVESLPLVRNAEASRRDPLTVVIDVEERVPHLVIVAPDGEVLVDREGIVIDRGRVVGLPELVVAAPAPALGTRVEGAHAAAFAVHESLPGPLRAEVARTEAASPEEVVLVLDRGTRVLVGRPDRLDEKARALGAVLEDIGTTEVATIDVRAPTAPAVRR